MADMEKQEKALHPKLVDVFIKLINFLLSCMAPKKLLRVRFANFHRENHDYMGKFAKGQFTTVFSRLCNKYKYHPQQQYESKVRKFDLCDTLRVRMENNGTVEFYEALRPNQDIPNRKTFPMDRTLLRDIGTPESSGRYLYEEKCRLRNMEAAKAAVTTYMAGYSREIDVFDYNDWAQFRKELSGEISARPYGNPSSPKNVSFVALSYKGVSEKITRRMQNINEDGTPKENESEKENGFMWVQEDVKRTRDVVEDFRWSQVVRSCKAVAERDVTTKVRVWIDRLINMRLTKEQQKMRHEHVAWEEYGLLAYGVCSVIRVYERGEIYFGTDFWRKLELVLGVAGKGLIVDEYMVHHYDDGLYYGEGMYKKCTYGVSCIGGGGVHMRSVTLALATAILTDGVSLIGINEDIRTMKAVESWKAWAFRSIAEGAYSLEHSSLMMQDKSRMDVGLGHFLTVVFWESMVSKCKQLAGNSYLDMSYQRSMNWRKAWKWTGITEWIGMADMVNITDRAQIMEYLNANMQMRGWIATTGHVAVILTLKSVDKKEKRSLVVQLSRCSTLLKGYVTAVAEGTGLWGKCILPWYLRFTVNPDRDQQIYLDKAGLEYTYHQIATELFLMEWVRVISWVIAYVIGAILSLTGIFFLISEGISLRNFLILLCGLLFFAVVVFHVWIRLEWPWTDLKGLGEGVFDNLLLHSLYASGIKKRYRSLVLERYEDVQWS